VAELADALDSGSSARKGVGVQVPSFAQHEKNRGETLADGDADHTADDEAADTSQTNGPGGRGTDVVSVLRAKAAELVIAGRIDDARKVLDALEAITPAAAVLDLAHERARRGRR
jgi:hypothetical protein